MTTIEAFARDRGMDVRPAGEDALLITVRASPDFTVEVTVAESVYEWFIHVRDAVNGKLVFEDWCDHQGYDDSTPDELQRELYEAVTAYLSAVQGATLRVHRPPGWLRVPELQVWTDAGWTDVWDLPPPSPA